MVRPHWSWVIALVVEPPFVSENKVTDSEGYAWYQSHVRAVAWSFKWRFFLPCKILQRRGFQKLRINDLEHFLRGRFQLSKNQVEFLFFIWDEKKSHRSDVSTDLQAPSTRKKRCGYFAGSFFCLKNVQLFEAQKLLDAKTRWPSSLSNFFGLEDVPKVEGGPGLMGPLGPLGFIGWYFVTHWKGIFCGKLTHGFPIFLFTHLEIQS